MSEAAIVHPEVVESLARARAAVDAPRPPVISPSARRTLERLLDRLRDQIREGFPGDHLQSIDRARQAREEVAALEEALRALGPRAGG